MQKYIVSAGLKVLKSVVFSFLRYTLKGIKMSLIISLTVWPVGRLCRHAGIHDSVDTVL